MSKITKIWAREILDSRGIPTVEAACLIDSGQVGVSSVPAGTSTGKYEAIEIRDSQGTRYRGKGVQTAVDNVNNILGPALIGMDVTSQEDVDNKLIGLDGTENKSKYGSNAILAISEAVCKSGALAAKSTLYNWINALTLKYAIEAPLKIPIPIFNMINGGLHGAGNLDFQEFHVIPSSLKTFSDGLGSCVEIYMVLGETLARRGAIHSVGNEGGYAPNLFTNAEAFQIVVESIKSTNYSLGRDVSLGLDVAASFFYKDGEYHIKDKSSPLDESEMIEYYKSLNTSYHLALLEDPFEQDAWGSWKKILNIFKGQVTIVGDDLLVTNPKRVEKAISEQACNGILVKPNQIGTITETLKVIKIARDADWKVIVSHRSGETNDSFIADFAVGVGADYTKFGAPARGERVAKYNRLLAIESELLRIKK